MDCKIKNELGTVYIPEEVIAMVAGNACVECYGIVAMGTKNATDGIVEIFKKDNLSKGVKVLAKDNAIAINTSIIVEYGISITAVAQSAIDTIKYNVENITGLKVDKVNINVVGIRV